MIGIFYPYLESASKWEELRYSLRSLEKFFEEEYEVWIVGDKPDWIRNVRHIPHTPETGRVMSPVTYDAIMKLATYIDEDDSPDKFIRMYDDIYFVGKRNLLDLEVTRYLLTYEELQAKALSSGSFTWRDQVRRTVAAVRAKGYAGLMTETHCPEIFEKDNMREIFDLFDPLEGRLLTSTLYYNVFPFERMLKDRDTERILFYGEGGNIGMGGHVGQPIQGKYFLNHNDKGLNAGLKRFIKGMFREKSRFEK